MIFCLKFGSGILTVCEKQKYEKSNCRFVLEEKCTAMKELQKKHQACVVDKHFEIKS